MQRLETRKHGAACSFGAFDTQLAASYQPQLCSNPIHALRPGDFTEALESNAWERGPEAAEHSVHEPLRNE
jgi:hypothetical protein